MTLGEKEAAEVLKLMGPKEVQKVGQVLELGKLGLKLRLLGLFKSERFSERLKLRFLQ